MSENTLMDKGFTARLATHACCMIHVVPPISEQNPKEGKNYFPAWYIAAHSRRALMETKG
jgi:hypothetical protein